jgi:REP element-mobilizing transposase RayT
MSAEIQDKLWPYLGGIAKTNGFRALAVGGTHDHVHILLSLPATLPVSKAVQLLKGGSSKWMNETLKTDFRWQEGYGAFTLGVSQKPDTVTYIQSQAEHHKKHSFEEEFLAFLKKHSIDYDPKYVWG